MNNNPQIRNEFVQLREKVYGRNLVYLDNAATSLRPLSVVQKWTEMSLKYNSNLHRAVHYMAQKATQEYETARVATARFIGATDAGCVVFTSGATASLNLLAYTFGESQICSGDEIIIAQSEHHSDIVPWQMLCRRKGAAIKVLPVDDNGNLMIDTLEQMLRHGKTKLCCVSHVSNVLGIVNPIEEIVRICHSKGCAVSIDGAQGIVHCGVDVGRTGCDFYSFSGHKIYAAPGTGVLYISDKWKDIIPPFMTGGEMIQTVKFENTTFAEAPQKFEAGTQNISGVPTLVPAYELAEEMEFDSRITQYMMQSLSEIKGLHLFGKPDSLEQKVPLFSFTVDGAHHEDLAILLDKMGIAVRSGQMCAEPLMDRFSVTGMLRASFAPYNTMDEAEYFISSLQRAIKMLV